MRSIIIGNWKMNTTVHQGKELACDIKDKLAPTKGVEVVLCPPATHLKSLYSETFGDSLRLGAQNIHYEESGAFTGEISVKQIKEFCKYVIIGHSERRAAGETDAEIFKKVKLAIKNNLTPVLCVGEDFKTRKAGKTNQFIKDQINKSIPFQLSALSSKLLIAYEPVWAIGTGRQPKPEEIEQVVNLIKKIIGSKAKVLYGGSVTSKNSKKLAEIKSISGVLVGGASLKAREFVKIVEEFSK